MSYLEINHFRTILVAGGGHGIGLGFVKRFLFEAPDAKIYATYRDPSKSMELIATQKKYPERISCIQLDLTKEVDCLKVSELIRAERETLCAAINCIGYLFDAKHGPEKRLSDIDPEHIAESFRVNSVPSLLLAKHLMPLFKNSNPSIFAVLSARVGSIEDNRSGGWYSYRASKAALNMFIKNIALEFDRYKCSSLVLALHPGTTVTALSKPFISKTPYQIHQPESTAENLIKVMQSKSAKDSGGFYDWRGEKIPW